MVPISPDEWQQIREVSLVHGVDYKFVAAIRQAEGGGPGREFGILKPGFTTFRLQLGCCVVTVHNYLLAYLDNPFGSINVFDKSGRVKAIRLIYKEAFVAYAARKYAPVGASNDPEGLNQNWFNNVRSWYAKYAGSWEEEV